MNDRDFLFEVLKGDVEAITLCEVLAQISQTWDDLVDEPATVAAEGVNRMMWQALVVLPNNAFYQHHFATLNPLIRAIITDWLDANALENGSVHDKHIAFVLRDTLTGLVVQCAGIIGGYDWMREVGPAVRRQFHDETLDEFLEERL